MNRNFAHPAGGISRRQVLKTVRNCTAVTSCSMLSQMLNLKLMTSAMADIAPPTGDYKAVVCLFLFGGIDSYHMLIPNDDDGYADYVAARGGLISDSSVDGLALDRADGGTPSATKAIPITDSTGREFALHPTLGDMKELFDNGDLGFVGNVGALREPTDLASYNRGQGTRLPVGLFSHSDQQQHWMTGVPQSRTQLTGWLGRMADCITDPSNDNNAVSMNISLGGLNILQTGDDIAPYVVGTNGATTLASYGFGSADFSPNDMFTRMTDGVLSQNYADLLGRTHSTARRGAINAAAEFNNATNNVTLNTVFPTSGIGQQLRRVAMTIAGRNDLGRNRQTFFVTRGGWDHHDGVVDNTTAMFPEIAAALKAFNAAMIELGVHDDVVLFSASDFGRTLSSNGNGSDHAWGGNAIVMGGGIQGGTVHGGPNHPAYPISMAPGNSLDTGRGRLIPTTSVDELAAELALWFGVPNDGNLETILPNIREFYASGASSAPLGMFT